MYTSSQRKYSRAHIIARLSMTIFRDMQIRPSTQDSEHGEKKWTEVYLLFRHLVFMLCCDGSNSGCCRHNTDVSFPINIGTASGRGRTL